MLRFNFVQPLSTRHTLQNLQTTLNRRAVLSHKRRHGTLTSEPVEDPHDALNFGEYSIILPEEPYVFGVSHIKPRAVPKGITLPEYAKPGYVVDNQDRISQPERIVFGGMAERRVREAGDLARRVLEYAGKLVRVRREFRCRALHGLIDNLQVGVTTNDIDAAVHDFVISHNAYPSPLRYSGFPKSCCTRYGAVPTSLFLKPG